MVFVLQQTCIAPQKQLNLAFSSLLSLHRAEGEIPQVKGRGEMLEMEVMLLLSLAEPDSSPATSLAKFCKTMKWF